MKREILRGRGVYKVLIYERIGPIGCNFNEDVVTMVLIVDGK